MPYDPNNSPAGLSWHDHTTPDSHPTSCTACAFAMVTARLEATERVVGFMLKHQKWLDWARDAVDPTPEGKKMLEDLQRFIDLTDLEK